jgi:SAM-dependent methyltransferase
MMNNKIHEKYLEVHNQMLNLHGFNTKALWGSKESQNIRFLKLTELFKSTSNFSVLDIGCGLCDFYFFLIQNGYTNIHYTGLEINDKFYKNVKEKNPELNIILGSIENIELSEKKWDYVVASGIYNLGSSEVENQNEFISNFKEIYNQIRIGFAVNFLSQYSNKKDKLSIYHHPDRLIERCKENFGSFIKFDHTYLPHDFTIFIYKN